MPDRSSVERRRRISESLGEPPYSTAELASLIDDVPDFPKKGILFKDITTLLKDARAFRQAIDQLTSVVRGYSPRVVIGMESRGFIFAAPIAYLLGAGFVPVRKLGKLPGEVISAEYDLEYGTNTLELHSDAISAGDRVLIVDDLLATGGTVSATIELVERLGGQVVAVAFLVELTALKGRDRLGNYEVASLIQF
jgi:adenine phosphoribosyltransferase